MRNPPRSVMPRWFGSASAAKSDRRTPSLAVSPSAASFITAACAVDTAIDTAATAGDAPVDIPVSARARTSPSLPSLPHGLRARSSHCSLVRSDTGAALSCGTGASLTRGESAFSGRTSPDRASPAFGFAGLRGVVLPNAFDAAAAAPPAALGLRQRGLAAAGEARGDRLAGERCAPSDAVVGRMNDGTDGEKEGGAGVVVARVAVGAALVMVAAMVAALVAALAAMVTVLLTTTGLFAVCDRGRAMGRLVMTEALGGGGGRVRMEGERRGASAGSPAWRLAISQRSCSSLVTLRSSRLGLRPVRGLRPSARRRTTVGAESSNASSVSTNGAPPLAIHSRFLRAASLASSSPSLTSSLTTSCRVPARSAATTTSRRRCTSPSPKCSISARGSRSRSSAAAGGAGKGAGRGRGATACCG